MNMVERQESRPNDTLRSVGFSLLFLGMVVGGLARSIHVSEAVQIGMSIGSGLLSVSAIVLFVKAAKSNRRPTLVLTLVAVVAALAAVAFVVLHK